jgi:thioredoxin-like negative regulator of GroEL
VVREVALELAGRCAVIQVNTRENPGLAGRFNISGIPAILMLRDGKVLDSISGAQEKGALLTWCRRHLV